MNDKEIKRWIHTQRSGYKRGILPEWKTKILNQVNFTWTALDSSNLVMKYPLLLKEWDYDKNVNIDPTRISYGSGATVWWKCDNHHSWNARVYSRVRGRSCPYCNNQLVSKTNCLQSKYPSILKYWHPTKNNNVVPSDVIAGTGKKYWFLSCKKCGYSVYRTPKSHFQRKHRSRKCPSCNSLENTYPDLMCSWHPTRNGKTTPSDITVGSNKKVWWICKGCKISHKTTILNKLKSHYGCFCRKCGSKKIYNSEKTDKSG